jgi:predicted ATPase/two-component sensor histidine kinase
MAVPRADPHPGPSVVVDELTQYEFEILSDDGSLVLFRGRSREGQPSILVRCPSGNSFTTTEHERLSREYALANEFDEAWAARPRLLGEWAGKPALVISDPGGSPLSSFQRQSLDLDHFLRIAIAIARSLRQLHNKGLIHRDLRPANLLLDEKWRVWLTGFGVATTLPRERVAPILAEATSDSLKYMAPEQTGRMNRSIDARSDLYSLGVTLYEMLTGALPFNAAGPMEWIHCHIARQPRPPSDQIKGVPGPVSAIVLKLLAKTAEDRYQTAAGVEADLRHCLKSWEADRYIEPFPLGARDASDRLLIPEKLYGREAEIRTLVGAVDRITAHGARELVLISGYSGIGKSSIVNELQKVLVPSRGLLAAGKFDQYKRNIPYATVAQAFQGLIRQILSRSNDEVGRWREALQGAVGSHGQLLINLIPELALIIGEQQPVPDLPPQEARNRFQLLFRRFLMVFAQREHPLVLFLDDLQWLDAATIELLEHLVNQPDVQYLLIIGAYRDNEVTASHPLSRSLEMIRGGGTTLHEIVLAPLTRHDVSELAGDATHVERDRAEPLAELVFEKTGGNPFFVIQFITTLAEDGLLAFDQSDLIWRWDLDRIRSKGFTDNVLDLMAGRLNRLPGATQEALKQLASLGSSTQIKTLSLIRGESGQEIDAPLWEVVRSGLVLRSGDAYTFLHDRVQEASYALIPEGERAATHLRIGRLLASATSPAELEEKIFEIVNQLDRGMSLIDSLEERVQVAELNLIAGKRAKASTAYASALAYLQAGRTLLPEDSWERHYQLNFALEYHLAECEFLTGDLSTSEERLSALLHRAHNLIDRAAVTWQRVTLYTALGRMDRAIEIGLEYLKEVGVEWTPHPSREQVLQEYEPISQEIKSGSIEERTGLPPLRDPDRLATFDVLSALLPPAFFSDPNLVCLILCRATNISRDHGNSDASALCYAYLGMMLGPYFENYAAMFRFAKLGLDLVEELGMDRFKARVRHTVGSHVIPFTKPLLTARPMLRQAFSEANEGGDLTYAGFSSCTIITNLLGRGDPLGDVQREAEEKLEFVRNAKFGLIIDIITGQLRLVLALQGLTSGLSSFDDREFKEEVFEQHLEGDPGLAIATCWYWIRKLQAQFYANDHGSALATISKVEPLLWTTGGFFELAEYHLFAALARAAAYDTASADEQRQYREAILAHYKEFQIWTENCRETFEHRGYLIAGEIARIENRDIDAMRLYEQAVQSARKDGLLHLEALAFEVAARFYAARSFKTVADAYVANARLCYLHWGAKGKVRQMEQVYPHLREPTLPSGEPPLVGRYEGLDLANVVKTSLAVSGEVGIEKLIETLMVIVLEHAGAERGLLILPRGNELWIEAEAVTSRQAVDVRLRRTIVAASDLPESILRYVVRTREIVLLDDAKTPNQFSDDEFIALKASRSILCLPITSKAKLIGVLYLENNLSSHVFTPARIEVLKLLASQAAISLENAALEEKEALLREVHHRVKNNLQLISSLLSLQAVRVRDPAVAELFAESRDRVRSMALVHENLYRLGNFARVPMKPQLESVCAQLFRAYAPNPEQISLHLDIDEVQLDLDRAIACGLIVNELVSNALKHAFPDGRRGGLWISLQSLEADDCLLRIRDDGVGMSKSFDLKTAETLGLQLVNDLADQLHGSVAMRGLDGVDIAITFQTAAGRKTTP